jgi:hypothetical protein
MKAKHLIILIFSLAITTSSCNKDTNAINIDLTASMLMDKTWFLEYKQSGNLNQTYVGQSSYFISFYNDNTTIDSDGNKGSYSILSSNKQLQIIMNTKTINGNDLDYSYQVVSVGESNLILSFSFNGQITKMFFSTKK